VALLVDLVQQSILQLNSTRFSIGRDQSCDLSLEDPLVSRKHAELLRESAGGYTIKDLDSTHGTFVAGAKVSEHKLVDGDEIIVGATRFRFFHSDEEMLLHKAHAKDAEKKRDWSLDMYPKLNSVWQTCEQFFANLELRDGPARLFHPVRADFEFPPQAGPGALLSVFIRLLDRQAPDFHLHAYVIEKRVEGKKRGILLEFLEEEKDRLELVLVCAEGESIPHFRRRYERTDCRLPAKIKEVGRKWLDCTAIDISEGGLGLVPDHELRPETLIVLSIEYDDDKTIELNGRVASVVPRGPQQGLGIEFLFESAKQRDQVADCVAILRSRLKR